MNSEGAIGKHAAFYYYGVNHLYVNIAYRLEEAQKNNEKVLLFMDNIDFNSLLNILKKESKIQLQNVEYIDAIDKINGATISDEEVISILNNLVLTSRKEGYEGLCIIGLCDYFINKLSLEQFIEIEKCVEKSMDVVDLDVICAYDIEKYINDKSTINEKIIRFSKDYHRYLYTNFSFVEMKKVLNI